MRLTLGSELQPPRDAASLRGVHWKARPSLRAENVRRSGEAAELVLGTSPGRDDRTVHITCYQLGRKRFCFVCERKVTEALRRAITPAAKNAVRQNSTALKNFRLRMNLKMI